MAGATKMGWRLSGAKMAKIDEVSWCCRDCGMLANQVHNTVYGRHVPVATISTYHQDKCDLCGRTDVSVTELRDFGYPDLRLVNWNRIKKLVKEEDE